jgi:hypothetical protein
MVEDLWIPDFQTLGGIMGLFLGFWDYRIAWVFDPGGALVETICQPLILHPG